MTNDSKAALPADSGKGSARKKTMTYGLALIVVSGILLLMVGVSLSVGRYHISFQECWRIVFGALFSGTEDMDPLSVATVMKLRFPRTIAAVIVGGSLALSGAAYQSIFKNPMVSPDLLGVSSGACIGAAIAILMDGNGALIQFMAFVTGLAEPIHDRAVAKGAYLETLNNDVSWFVKKFDYRYEAEPWGNAKDAPERAIAFLNGRIHEEHRDAGKQQ